MKAATDLSQNGYGAIHRSRRRISSQLNAFALRPTSARRGAVLGPALLPRCSQRLRAVVVVLRSHFCVKVCVKIDPPVRLVLRPGARRPDRFLGRKCARDLLDACVDLLDRARLLGTPSVARETPAAFVSSFKLRKLAYLVRTGSTPSLRRHRKGLATDSTPHGS